MRSVLVTGPVDGIGLRTAARLVAVGIAWSYPPATTALLPRPERLVFVSSAMAAGRCHRPCRPAGQRTPVKWARGAALAAPHGPWVLLNGPGFTAGGGCALHLLALHADGPSLW